jgi:hypothetical protein
MSADFCVWLQSLLGKWDFFTCITPVENYDALMRMCHSNKALMEAQVCRLAVSFSRALSSSVPCLS